jgi:hypothetical protein
MPMAPSARIAGRRSRRFPRPLVVLALAFALFAAPGRVHAQVRGIPGVPRPTETSGDTTRARHRRPPPPDTTRVNGISPKGAFLRSLVIPGWGQSRIGSPGRGGVYFGLEASSLWMVYKAQRKVEDARRREHELKNAGLLPLDKQSGLLHSRLSQREDWITLSLFWLFFSGADAYVSTHLANFNAHVGTLPAPDGGVQVQATVPVGKKP